MKKPFPFVRKEIHAELKFYDSFWILNILQKVHDNNFKNSVRNTNSTENSSPDYKFCEFFHNQYQLNFSINLIKILMSQ